MAFNMLPTGMSFQRLGQFPLDSSSVYNTLAEAMDYVKNNPTAYPGQIIYIADARTEEEIANNVEPHEAMYMITKENDIKLVVSEKSLDMDEMVEEVNQQVGQVQENLDKAVEAIGAAMNEKAQADETKHQQMSDELKKHMEIADSKFNDLQKVSNEKHAEMEQAMADMKAEMEETAKAKHEEMKAEADAEHAEMRELMDEEKPYLADVAAYPTSKFLFACGHPITVEPNVGHKFSAKHEENAVAFVYRWADSFECILVDKAEAEKIYLVGGYGDKHVNVKRPIPQTNMVVKNVKIKGVVGGSYFEGMVGHVNMELENADFVSIVGAGWCGASLNGQPSRMNIVDDVNIKATNCKISSTFFGGAQGNGVANNVNVEFNNCEIGWLTAGGSNGMTRNAKVVMNGGSVTVAQSTNRGIVNKARFVLNDGVVNNLYFGGETEDSSVDGMIENGFVELNGGKVNKFSFGTNDGMAIVSGNVKGSIRDCVVESGDTSMLEQFKHMFFGGDAKNVACANGEEVKALAGKERVDAKEVVFEVPAGSQRVTVATPENVEVKEIQYMGQGCADYKDMFESSVVEVSGNYNVMTYIFAIPCSNKMAFRVILG